MFLLGTSWCSNISSAVSSLGSGSRPIPTFSFILVVFALIPVVRSRVLHSMQPYTRSMCPLIFLSSMQPFRLFGMAFGLFMSQIAMSSWSSLFFRHLCCSIRMALCFSLQVFQVSMLSGLLIITLSMRACMSRWPLDNSLGSSMLNMLSAWNRFNSVSLKFVTRHLHGGCIQLSTLWVGNRWYISGVIAHVVLCRPALHANIDSFG